MNKSEIFKSAHAIAKAEMWVGRVYAEAFSYALRRIYKRIRAQKFIDIKNELHTRFLEVSRKYWEGEATDAEYTAAQTAVENASIAISQA